MNYAKLYVDVYTHPRFIKAGFQASGYWMHALAYLRHQESSDGFLAEEAIAVPLASNKALCRRLCERLVSVGLFRKVEGGYFLLRYADRNETKADILVAKAAARERKAQSRQRRAGPTPSSPDPLAVTATVTRDTSEVVTSPVPSNGEGVSREASHVTSVYALLGSVSGSVSGSDLGSASASRRTPALDEPEARQRPAGDARSPVPASGDAPARRPLPSSERAVSGPYWLEAFTDGITRQTGRPCTAGRMYVATLERIVAHHAPDRDAGRACAWLREQARAFAAKWDGNHPPKGLTPDGLERWLNEGRGGPPQFGKPRLVQLPPDEWKPDDYSDLGAVMITGDGSSDGKANSHE